MKVALAVLLVAAALPTVAQDREDKAHRADRERTRVLDHRPSGETVRPQDQEAYERARAAYLQRLTTWRARVAACEAGRYDACE